MSEEIVEQLWKIKKASDGMMSEYIHVKAERNEYKEALKKAKFHLDRIENIGEFVFRAKGVINEVLDPKPEPECETCRGKGKYMVNRTIEEDGADWDEFIECPDCN